MDTIFSTPWGWAVGFAVGWVLARGLTYAVAYFTRGWVREKVATGVEGLLQARGVVRKGVSPECGKVFVRGELWNARSTVAIEIGAAVRIVSIHGLLLEVEPT